MTIAEFLALPEDPRRMRSLIAGRLFERPARPRDRQTRAAVERLIDLLRRDSGFDLRTDFLLRHEPGDLFRVEVAAVPSGGGLPVLVVLIPRSAETYGETHGKIDACLAAGVGQVWELEFYMGTVEVHRPDERPLHVRKTDPLPQVPGLPIITAAEIFRDLPEPESALPNGLEELWMDILREKHECFGTEHTSAVEVSVSGRNVRLILPDYLAETEILVIAEREDLLFAIGRQNYSLDNDGPLGVVMVARRHDSDTYLTHVWHELYPYVFKYLGLESRRDE